MVVQQRRTEVVSQNNDPEWNSHSDFIENLHPVSSKQLRFTVRDQGKSGFLDHEHKIIGKAVLPLQQLKENNDRLAGEAADAGSRPP